MTDVTVLFRGWEPVVRVVLVGIPMYVALVALMRISGSRSLASMNAFDFVVTVAIGAAFGSSMTSSDVALAEAVTAFALLLGLQYVVSWVNARWPPFSSVITNPPTLVYYRDEFLREQMRDQRVTEDELRAAVRKQRIGSMDDVEGIVLESSGEVSVITDVGDGSALGDLAPDEERDE